jgi:protein AroM
MSVNKVGVVTIGQSPRPDVVGEITRILGDSYEVIEVGALDSFSLEEVRKMEPEPGQGLLVTRMRDGTEVKINHDSVLPYLQRAITELNDKQVKIILLLCTGRFPEFKSNVLVVTPSQIVRGVTNASIRKGKLGMILPSIQQVGGAPRIEDTEGLTTYYDSASPYGSIEDVKALGDRLAENKVDLTFLNCMGFDHNHKKIIMEKTGKPVIQSSSLVARVMKELLES